MASANYNPKTGITTYTIEYDPNKPHWTLVKNVELTDECIDKIADAVVKRLTADTPQTDCDKCIWSVCNYNRVDWDADTPQTDCAWR